MYRRTLDSIRAGLCKLRLRVKYQIGFANLPAVATHLACFLAGSLLFEPDKRGKVPAEMLVPWSMNRLVGAFQIASEYQIVSESRACLLSAESFRLWRPESQRIFVILPKPKQWAELAGFLQRGDTRLYRKDKLTKPLCQKMRANATIYP